MQTSSYKINNPWGWKVEYREYINSIVTFLSQWAFHNVYNFLSLSCIPITNIICQLCCNLKKIIKWFIRFVHFTLHKIYLIRKVNKYWTLVDDMHAKCFEVKNIDYPQLILKCIRKIRWMDRDTDRWIDENWSQQNYRT